ncbi:DUF5677 domain-containing protein [Rhodocytophaga aerolata]|uniref:DUF5677 domain-containing protein n=1 Tax=Rhodocytophaga aerolata TaxID=455078 RepID=A0ABT8RIU5_9BACT|nr:DUF5677 domain-containing protein [Rhodocytophaga aerolata]MDO1451093.1 DUF5677 domain-containing protein [Rhodocytophaga aerolata]
MNILQNLFDSVLQEHLDARALIREILLKKFGDLGIKIKESQINQIISHVESSDEDGISIDLEDEQLLGSKIASVTELTNNITLEFNNEYIKEALEGIILSLSEELPSIIDKTADVVLNKIYIHSVVEEHIQNRKGFEQRLWNYWKEPFELFEQFILIVLDAGVSFNEQYHQNATNENDLVFEVLTRLHARACQVASEVLVLLESGFADGAHARWRTLHEITVSAMFVAKHGDKVAEKYLEHEIVELYKAANQYQEHCVALGQEPLTEEELNKIQFAYNNVLSRYGNEFKEGYGWAANTLSMKKPNFTDIEMNVGLEKWRPYYKMASYNVHGNAKGIAFQLGALPTERRILLAGATNYGFTDPAHGTVISLLQITTTFLMTKPNFDSLTICSLLTKLQKKIGEEFLKTQRKLKQQHVMLGKI